MMKSVAGGLSLLFAVSGMAGSVFASAPIHNTHVNGVKGDFGLDCLDCHKYVFNEWGAYEMVLDEQVCVACHSPDGAYDGMNDSAIGALNNLPGNYATVSLIYDEDGNLKPGKEKWCLGCHDDGTSVARDVSAPNVAGKSIQGDWQSPAATVDNGFLGIENLVDGNLDTGSISDDAKEMIFDLGSPQDVTHVRINGILDEATYWEVYGSNDLVNWDEILYGSAIRFGKAYWQVGPVEGWEEYRLDKFEPVQYLKFVRATPNLIAVNALREVQYKGDLQYGYEVSGHKISCDNCHDTTSIHVDGVAQTYKADLKNYSSGYRLADVLVGAEQVPAMQIPREDCNNGDNPRTDNDFALCLSCHDRYNLLGDAYGTGGFFKHPLQTNFRNDEKVDENGNVVNDHLNHLQGRGFCGNAKDWDSDWDGVPDSPQSCTACHNVHGSPNPVMTRHGELASTPGTSDKVPMFNFQFLDQEGEVDPDLKDVSLSSGGIIQRFGGGPGNPGKNNTCRMCHNDRVIYKRTP